MTNETLFEDLKQLFVASLGQLEGRLTDKIEDIEAKLDAHRAETRAGFEGVGDAISALTDEHDKLERRVTKLEAAPIQG